MFFQEKEYLYLFKGNEKLMTAGLCKQVVWDQKIKIDYYLDHLPIAEGGNGKIHLDYLVRTEGENSLIKKEVVEKIVFSKSILHYSVTKREGEKYQIVKIDDCYIEFEEDYVVQTQRKMRAVQAQEIRKEQTKELSAQMIQETDTNKFDLSKNFEENEKPEDEKSKQKYNEEVVNKEEKIKETKDVDLKNEGIKNAEKKNEIRRIDDLKVLLQQGEDFVELYYNSFLLHSFYQYRHILLSQNFVAVPDYFYEREAIAAKMMGFPFFVEAKDIDTVCLDQKCSTNMPKDGTYGYFLRKL